MKSALQLACVTLICGCFGSDNPDTGSELEPGSSTVSLTIDGTTTAWESPGASFVEVDQTDWLTISDLSGGQGSLDLMVPDNLLPGVISDFEICPEQYPDPDVPCGLLFFEQAAFYDVVSGSYTVAGDPEPQGEVTGSFSLQLAHRDGTGETGSIQGRFSAYVNGY